MTMDDSCAVCAEALEWVAYGPCGHREVCATCVARLRFVCRDRRCCLCQSDSTVVFVTKASGQYTRSINDFSIFPDDVKEGKVGSFWYNEDIQAFFDDFHQYKTIRAMSKLSCNICDSADGKAKEDSKRKGKFRSVDHLRSHISNRHELFMCSLCLEGRKVFLSEQKLYSRAQLERHFEKGDPEVDGNESERCGFSGHPLCEFCQLNFYGDNELYFHLSTDHFTCHICKRQHPGSYQYYRDYDDLEKHFRHAHCLCEDSSCLEKKFIVFATVAEMKRHRALEHGGNMSRSERNASLQISTCFRYRERNEEDNSRRREIDLIAISELSDDTSSGIPSVFLNGGTSLTGLTVASSAHHEVSSGHSQATGSNSSYGLLEDSSFPPLPSSSSRRTRKSRNTAVGTGKATRLHRRYDGSLTVTNTRLSKGQPSSSSSSNSFQSGNTSNLGLAFLSDPAASSQNSFLSSCENPLSNGTDIRKVGRNSPSLNIGNRRSLDTFTSGVTSAAETNELPASGRGMQNFEETQTVNKSLIERLRADLGFDKDKFAAFKFISKEYKQGVISAREYLAYVHQFRLSHLVVDIARLCPDPQKQKELLEIHDSCFGESSSSMGKTGSKKGKEKCIDQGSSSSRKGKEKECSNNSNAVKGKDFDEKIKADVGKLSLTEPKGNGGGDGSSNPLGTRTGVKKKQKNRKF